MFKFENLEVWKKALEYANDLLELADTFPQRYQFSLGDQLRRAGISTPNNIAEATGRTSKKESTQLFNIAKGSTYETVNLLRIALKRGMISDKQFGEFYSRADEICRMLSGIMK